MSNDKDVIEQLGGAAKVASLLGFTVQRVQNWKDRGIPARVRLDRQDLFETPKPPKRRRRQAAPP